MDCVECWIRCSDCAVRDGVESVDECWDRREAHEEADLWDFICVVKKGIDAGTVVDLFVADLEAFDEESFEVGRAGELAPPPLEDVRFAIWNCVMSCGLHL